MQMGLNGVPSTFPTTFAILSDLLDPTLLAAVVVDRRFAVAAVIALVSGAARGFSGFGSAMIYIPWSPPCTSRASPPPPWC
jgi:hypothetical protein